MSSPGLRLALVFLAFPLVSCGPGETGEISRGRVLVSGDEIERTIAVGESHTYSLPLATGDYLELSVEQRGVDVTIAVDSGFETVEYDRPNRLHGPEEVPFVARITAPHRVVVRCIEGSGVYHLQCMASPGAEAEQRQRDATARALAEARLWREIGSEEGMRRAAGLFAIAIFEVSRSGDEYAAAMAWRELAQTRALQARPAAALGAYREARKLLQHLGDARQTINLHNLESACLLRLGEPGRALESAQRALAMARALGDHFSTAVALNNSALGRRQSGETEASLRDEEEAVVLWERLGLQRNLALTLRNLGNGYLALGREEEALEALQRSRELFRNEADEAGEAASTAFIGQALARRGEMVPALAELAAARAAQERLGDSHAVATTLGRLAEVRAASGDLAGAEEAWEHAIELYSRTGDPLHRAWIVTERAWWRLQGMPELRQEWDEINGSQVESALELFEERGDPAGRAFALLALARGRATADASPERLSNAVGLAEMALELFENLRAEVSVPAYRRSLLATRHAFYETLIAVLIQLDESQPGLGYAERAFAVSERSRSRVLLDHLSLGQPLERAEIEDQLFERSTGDGALLLEFHLGVERSYLFLVGRDLFRVAVLPNREVLEMRARNLHELLARRDRALAETQAGLIAAELGELLFGEVRSEMATANQLLIVPDGALHYLPFSVLVADGRQLIEDHEVVRLPSASFLVRQRQLLAARPPALQTLAVVADPIYELDSLSDADPESIIPSRDLIRAAEEVGLEALVRLPGARREAEAALALVPAPESFQALGLEATREVVVSGVLGRYRFVHFAAHGFLNVRRPELSGLALSLVDSMGQRRDGFLRARDIEGLELSAELVVLSACRTGLGKEERGEGLVGLPQSFFTAGARRVIVSLWGVDDMATAQLMELFYAALLRDGLRPAEALRRAQLTVLAENSSPHAWAPFVLIGDWN